MAEQIITTKACPRCGGSGHYSYCLRYGTTCFQCGGTGRIAVAPKGQRRIKPTAESHRAVPGDIIEVGKVLYRVVEIRWIKPVSRGYYLYNQQMKVIRLVDEKELFLKREFHGIDPEHIACWTINPDGSKTPAASFIHTPEHLVGTLYEPGQFEPKRGEE
jgi:hypothetical protein